MKPVLLLALLALLSSGCASRVSAQPAQEPPAHVHAGADGPSSQMPMHAPAQASMRAPSPMMLMHDMRHGGAAVPLCFYAGAPYSPGALLRSSAGIVQVCTLPEDTALAAKPDTPPTHEHAGDGMRRAVWEIYRPAASSSRRP